ncbi:MAG: preprotein translocase subunit YajC [Flavobacteriales bacterium]|nr:MAG: preprotein translocase subunit YajC [Flavobacteriales bacterium]
MLYIFLQQSPLGGILPFLLVVAVMYFFFLRPQMKKQKEERAFAETVKKGDRVVTNSGIHGKINEVGDTFVVLEVDNGRLKVEKSALSKEFSAQYLPKEEKK